VPSPSSARSKALLGVLLCVGAWGVNYPATKIAYKVLSPLAYTLGGLALARMGTPRGEFEG
jgi:hypothetical protein